jgi:hypothetical protein
MTISRLHVTTFLAIAVLAWAIVLFVQGTPVSPRHLAPFGIVVGLLTLLAVGFEQVLWRQTWLHGWFVQRPDLRGTWKVVLQSDWINPENNRPIPPITCYVGVEQRLSELQMHLMTPESESWFIASAIRSAPSDSGYQIAGVYTNKPHIELRRTRSDMHFGALVIDTHGESNSRPESLTAEYWTDRKTTGRMTFTDRRWRVYTRFEDADAAFAAAGR